MKNYLCKISVVTIGCFLLANVLSAEDVNQIFENTKKYIADKNYTKALEELSWASKEIEKMHMQRMHDFFPDKLGEFSGDKFNDNAVLGMTNLERAYSRGSASIKLSLLGSSKGSGGPMAGLAGLGQLAAMFQGQVPGQESFRIKGRTAQVNSQDPSRAELMLFLNNGTMLQAVAISGEVEVADLKQLVEGLDLDALETYLKG